MTCERMECAPIRWDEPLVLTLEKIWDELRLLVPLNRLWPKQTRVIGKRGNKLINNRGMFEMYWPRLKGEHMENCIKESAALQTSHLWLKRLSSRIKTQDFESDSLQRQQTQLQCFVIWLNGISGIRSWRHYYYWLAYYNLFPWRVCVCVCCFHRAVEHHGWSGIGWRW